jgi:hypothetical protein
MGDIFDKLTGGGDIFDRVSSMSEREKFLASQKAIRERMAASGKTLDPNKVDYNDGLVHNFLNQDVPHGPEAAFAMLKGVGKAGYTALSALDGMHPGAAGNLATGAATAYANNAAEFGPGSTKAAVQTAADMGGPVGQITRPGMIAGDREATKEERLGAFEGAGELGAGAAMTKANPAAIRSGVADAATSTGNRMRSTARPIYNAAWGEKNAPILEKHGPQMMSEGIKTRTDLEPRIAAANQARSAAVAANKDSLIDVSGILNDLAAQKMNYIKDGQVINSAAVRQIVAIENKIKGWAQKNGGKAKAEALDAYRDELDNAGRSVLEHPERYTGDERNAATRAVDAADVMRARVNAIEPIGKASADSSYLLSAQTAQRGARSGAAEVARDGSFMAAFGPTPYRLMRVAYDVARMPNARITAAQFLDSLGERLGGKAPDGPTSQFSPQMAAALRQETPHSFANQRGLPAAPERPALPPMEEPPAGVRGWERQSSSGTPSNPSFGQGNGYRVGEGPDGASVFTSAQRNPPLGQGEVNLGPINDAVEAELVGQPFDMPRMPRQQRLLESGQRALPPSPEVAGDGFTMNPQQNMTMGSNFTLQRAPRPGSVSDDFLRQVAPSQPAPNHGVIANASPEAFRRWVMEQYLRRIMNERQ